MPDHEKKTPRPEDHGESDADAALEAVREAVAEHPEAVIEALRQGGVLQSLIVQTAVEQTFSGPIPPPNLLEEYERVMPGSADRILNMAERQAMHRQELERTVVVGGSRRANRGLVLGFIVALAVLAVGLLMALNDQPAAGAAVITTDTVALASVFVYGRRSQSKERAAKRQPSPVVSLEGVQAPPAASDRVTDSRDA